LPPYGARVLEAARRREPLNTYICADPDAWNTHRNRADRVVLPPDAPPDDFDWSIFRGQSPFVIAGNSDQGRIKCLIWLLLRAGATVVAVVFEEGGTTHIRHFRLQQ
jgi:hypothetical protein